MLHLFYSEETLIAVFLLFILYYASVLIRLHAESRKNNSQETGRRGESAAQRRATLRTALRPAPRRKMPAGGTLEELMLEMRESIAQSAQKRESTQELLQRLAGLLKGYRSLIRLEYIPVLQEWILSEVSQYPGLDKGQILDGRLWQICGYFPKGEYPSSPDFPGWIHLNQSPARYSKQPPEKPRPLA